ncbi:MAG: acetylglutamate kinase [Muribaculaceae bacterium]|nr:acetylglutamate kinase [Muribaculaceae bacterium]
MAQKITIVKVGGKILESPDTLDQLLNDFAKLEGLKLLVHGGGRSATKLAEKLDIETKMVDGRRITDDAMLEVVTMVYGGLVNKKVVALLQALGVNALGVTGADLNLLLSDRRPVKTIDYGWVGDVKAVNDNMLAHLLKSGIVPVIAPLTHDGKGNMLNTNADTMAGETAKGCAKHFDVTLVFCFEKEGVLANENDDNSVIPTIDKQQYEKLKEDKIVIGGMIPKLDNAFATIDAGVNEVIITKASNLGDLTRGTHVIK